MITSRRSPKISGIAELAVHLPSPAIESALGDLADQDRASEVRHVALIALEGHHRESSVRALLAAFPSAARERQWRMLAAILEAADPHLLTGCGDQLWLGRILADELPGVFEHHADARLRQRKQSENEHRLGSAAGARSNVTRLHRECHL
jgi:hypothetical protein